MPGGAGPQGAPAEDAAVFARRTMASHGPSKCVQHKFAGDSQGSGHTTFLPTETQARRCIQYLLGDGLVQEPSSPPAWKGASRSLPAGSSQPWCCLSVKMDVIG